MNLSKIDAHYVGERARILCDEFAGRNDRMDRYERMYRMDVYEDTMTPGEWRVSLPMAHNVVERMRALLITRPPTISVPRLSARPADEAKDEQIESYLYAVVHHTNFHKMLSDAEWFATCLGTGWLKVAYDAECADYGRFPLVISAPDPRSLYWRMSPQQDRIVELVHKWQRRRRDVQDEFGITLPQPAHTDYAAEAVWLDGDCEYIEYWCEEPGWEDIPEVKKDTRKYMADLLAEAMAAKMGVGKYKSKGPVNLDQYGEPGVTLQPQADDAEDGSQLPAEDATTGQSTELPPTPGASDESSDEPNTDEADEQANPADAEEATDEPVQPRPKRRKATKVIHSIIVKGVGNDYTDMGADGYAEGFVVKKAVVMYDRVIPYHKWSGISTPMPGSNSDLSVLYPLANGDAGKRSYGVMHVMNTLASIDLQTAIESPNSMKFIRNPPEGVVNNVDTAPGVVNILHGEEVGTIPVDSTNPAASRMMQFMSAQSDESTIPEILKGQFHTTSGAAITGMSSVFEMLIGFKQQDRERALRSVFTSVLQLTKAWADPTEGWETEYPNKENDYQVITIKPDDIPERPRVTVRLSASMPRDNVMEVNHLASLVQQNLMSIETFLSEQQKLRGVGWEKPEEEIQRIMRDKMMLSPAMAQMLGSALAGEYLDLLGGQGAITPETIAKAKALSDPQGPPNGGAPPGNSQGGQPPPGPDGGRPPNLPPGVTPPPMAGRPGGPPPMPTMPGPPNPMGARMPMPPPGPSAPMPDQRPQGRPVIPVQNGR